MMNAPYVPNKVAIISIFESIFCCMMASIITKRILDSATMAKHGPRGPLENAF